MCSHFLAHPQCLLMCSHFMAYHQFLLICSPFLGSFPVPVDVFIVSCLIPRAYLCNHPFCLIPSACWRVHHFLSHSVSVDVFIPFLSHLQCLLKFLPFPLSLPQYLLMCSPFPFSSSVSVDMFTRSSLISSVC